MKPLSSSFFRVQLRLACSWTVRTAFVALCLVVLNLHQTAMAKELTAAVAVATPPLEGVKPVLNAAAAASADLQDALDAPLLKTKPETEIFLFVGETRVLPAPGLRRIAIGSGKVLSANAIDGREVLLFANASGVSSLVLWDAAGRAKNIKVTVGLGDVGRSAREIATFLSGIANAKTAIIGDKVIVEGDSLGDRDLAKIDELAKRYPQIVNFTSRLGWEKMVMMDVKVVEFPTSLLRELGLKWTSNGGAAVGGIWAPGRRGNQPGLSISIPTGQGAPLPITNADGTANGIPLPRGLNVLSALNLGISATLNLLVTEGKASVLAEPQLSARNGSKATFLAGGEYPYTVSSIGGQTVLFKAYGIKLEIVPQVDRNGMVRAVIDAEVSAIDPSISTSAGPALSTRKTSTEFNVQAGETMVLAGLLSRRTATTIDKLPFLGDIPVLGALFRSKRYQNDETELIVFVTPSVVDAHTSSLSARVDQATQRLESELGRPPYLPAVSDSTPAAAPISLSKEERQPTAAAVTPGQLSVPEQTRRNTVPVIATPALPVKPATALTVKASAATAAASSTTAQVDLPSTAVSLQAAAIPSPVREPLPATAQPSAALSTARPNPPASQASKPALADTRRSVLPSIPIETEGDLAPGLYAINQYNLPLRTQPDLNSPVMRYLPLNTQIEVLAQPRRGNFVAVRINEQMGWALARWLRPI